MAEHTHTTKYPKLFNGNAWWAAIWGFAEATFFFFIPDIFISYRAMYSFRSALKACGFALLGALVGGTVMYVIASHNPAGALSFVDHVPTVTEETIHTVKHEYSVHGLMAVIYGPLRTAPYKIYAVLAPVFAIGYLPFIVISIIARLARFVVIATVTSGISGALKSKVSFRGRLAILAACWLTMYTAYFATHWI